MPAFTVQAFKWTGTYYNAVYDTSHTVTFNDDDASYGGSRDASETVSIDGGAAQETWGHPYSIEVSFTDTGGEDQVDTFFFFFTCGEWYFVPPAGSTFSEGATLGSYQSHTMGWAYADAVCFVSGTRILTDTGERAVEDLVAGDRVWTEAGGFQALALNLSRAVSPIELRANPKLAPVRINAGALGPGLPHRTLWVSRQHRILLRSRIAKRMFGVSRSLVAAIRLCSVEGIAVDLTRSRFSYHHLVFAGHEIVSANGALAESFLPGPQALSTLPPAALVEFDAIFPGAAQAHAPSMRPAALIPATARQKRLIDRHRKNGQPLFA